MTGLWAAATLVIGREEVAMKTWQKIGLALVVLLVLALAGAVVAIEDGAGPVHASVAMPDIQASKDPTVIARGK